MAEVKAMGKGKARRGAEKAIEQRVASDVTQGAGIWTGWRKEWLLGDPGGVCCEPAEAAENFFSARA